MDSEMLDSLMASHRYLEKHKKNKCKGARVGLRVCPDLFNNWMGQRGESCPEVHFQRHFSRMRSEGFLCSFLGPGRWWTVCGSFSWRGSLIAMPRCLWGKWEKVMSCDVWKQAWDFVALKRKSFWGSLMASSPLSMGRARKWCISRGRRGTLWQSRTKLVCWSLMASSPLSMGKVRKGDVLWPVKVCIVKCDVWCVKCEVWSVECGVWCGKLEVWSVQCEVWSVECEAWSVKCGAWSEVKCEVCSVQCPVWSVEFKVWREVWSVKCGVESVKCGVRGVKREVWSAVKYSPSFYRSAKKNVFFSSTLTKVTIRRFTSMLVAMGGVNCKFVFFGSEPFFWASSFCHEFPGNPGHLLTNVEILNFSR